MRSTQRCVDEALLGIDLLTEADMRSHLPDGEFIRGRFLGMVKSIIAIGRLPARTGRLASTSPILTTDSQ